MLALGLAVVECAGDALKRVAMLRPRKVMAEKAASASPASHSVDSSTALADQCVGTIIVTFASKKQLAVGAKRSSVCA